MKTILWILLFLPLLSWGQESKLVNGFAYLMLHDSKFGGGVIGNVNLLNDHIGLGPGVELTSYDGHLMVPVFADLKIKNRFGITEPYLAGQFGRNSYNVAGKDMIAATDGTQHEIEYNLTGKFFYGAGAGIMFHLKNVGLFASYIYRGYKYSRPDAININEQQVKFGNLSVNAHLFIIGVVF